MSDPNEDPKKPGPTGEPACGDLGPHDHGPIAAAVYTEAGKTIVNFGTPLIWMALTPHQVSMFAMALLVKTLSPDELTAFGQALINRSTDKGDTE